MILVFAGAGASYAVNCEQYPTTAEFYKRVPDQIRETPWFRAASGFLENRESGQVADIEDVIGVLSKMEDHCRNFFDENSFTEWIYDPPFERIRKISPSNRNHLQSGNLSTLIATMKEDAASLNKIRDDINALVYTLYGRKPDEIDLADWLLLLATLAESSQITEVFTTNYDRVLESVIDVGRLENKIETGIVNYGSDGTRLDLTCWSETNRPTSLETGKGKLTKLHGSANWIHGNDEDIFVGPPRFTGDLQNHITLYPGDKEWPTERPFIAFYEHLRWVARNAHAAIFVGYAFRDENINRILSDLPANIPVFVIDMEKDLPRQGFLQNAKHFCNGFSHDSAKGCIQGLKEQGLIARCET